MSETLSNTNANANMANPDNPESGLDNKLETQENIQKVDTSIFPSSSSLQELSLSNNNTNTLLADHLLGLRIIAIINMVDFIIQYSYISYITFLIRVLSFFL